MFSLIRPVERDKEHRKWPFKGPGCHFLPPRSLVWRRPLPPSVLLSTSGPCSWIPNRSLSFGQQWEKGGVSMVPWWGSRDGRSGPPRTGTAQRHETVQEWTPRSTFESRLVALGPRPRSSVLVSGGPEARGTRTKNAPRPPLLPNRIPTPTLHPPLVNGFTKGSRQRIDLCLQDHRTTGFRITFL